ncbi:S9 family peptidase [Chromatocurvus halotolerans]|uniref:Dipeptidyl aminopeptidase/acylaminoacyl peptidase n=1 Tax=Chromatocurvus halotolerans TaxID=1132028 RepID=A0A4R2KT61_9GAMM|nr:S9 family peptidase [Chromatocurvus halotolerans]TCO76994.1 dipeptidyl aminopeptidase/acylaminoacyl peptidase [Chromatocurvus halotolerans]
MKKRSTVVTALFILLLAPFVAIVQAQDARLSAEDYLEFEQVTDPQVSPDGRHIIYTRRSVDVMQDRWESALWIMDADGSRHRFLQVGSNPRWSPSGDRILFIGKDKNDKPQLFVRWMDGDGAVSQVTRVTVTPSSPHWSPDGEHIAFVAIVPAEDPWKIDMPKVPEGAEWTTPPMVLDRLHYRQDRVGYTEPGFSHLFVVPASSGTAKELTEGEWHVGAQFDGLFEGAGISWMPDSKTILFDGWNEPDGDLAYRRSHIYAIDMESRGITQLTDTPGFWSAPVASGDGQQIAFTGYPATTATYAMPRLYSMSSDGSNRRRLSADFDRPASKLVWDDDDRGVFFTAQDEGYINVFHMALSGSVRPVTTGKHVVSLSSRSGDTGVGIGASFHEPGDVVSFPLNGRGDPKQLTAVNADLLAGKELGDTEEIWYEAEDGNRAHGWIIKPPGFDPGKEYPLIMEIHGGPFAMYQGRFVFNYQFFAANDFVVLFTNPRGSTGYGEQYSKAIDFAYPGVDYLDLMGGVDAAIAEGFIDEKRLYVGGCSGGGVLSSWVIGHTDRFAAAAVRCPVTNWMSMAGTTDIPSFTFSFFEKPFWEDPGKWLEQSSLMYVGNVKTPTIIMTGEQDLRTPMPQSEEYYAALKMLGVPARLLRFNDQYHGTGTRPSNNIRTMLYMLSWYQQYTLDGEVEPETRGGGMD